MDVPLFFGQRMSPAVRDRGVHAGARRPGQPRARGRHRRRGRGGARDECLGRVPPGPVMRELGGPCLGVADQTRSWLVGYDQLIVAAGARDLNLAFRGWEKAGHDGRGRGPRAPHADTRPWPRGAWSSSARGHSPGRGDPRARPRHRGAGDRGGEPGPSRGRRGARPARGGRRALLPGARGRRGAREPRRARGGAPRRDRHGPPADPGVGARDRVRHRLSRRRPDPADRAAPDPGLPPRVPLGARQVRPRDRRGPAHEPRRRLRRPATSRAWTSARCWRRSARSTAGRRGGSGRRGGAWDDRAGPGAGAPPARLRYSPLAPAPRAHDYWRQWLQATLAAGRLGHPRVPVRGGDPGRAGRRPPPRYLGPRSAPMQGPVRHTSSRTGRPIRTR